MLLFICPRKQMAMATAKHKHYMTNRIIEIKYSV